MLPGVNAPFVAAAKALGASVDELKLISVFLLSYPLAAVLKRLPDTKPWQKNTFIIGVSLFYLVGMFDLWGAIRTILISALGTYAIAYYIDGSLMPWIAFVLLMGHMSISHIIRQNLNDPHATDVTGMQMVMVMKLSAFAWNVHDGRLKPEWLTETQKAKAIYEIPSLLDYFAYVMFFPSLFTGPAFDYADYRRWIETTMFEVKPNEKAPPTRAKRRIPRSGTPAAKKAAAGFIWLVLYIQMSGLYNTDVVLADSYWLYSFPRRIWILYMLGFTSRLKYYAVWTLTEGACILSGLGYNGLDPKTSKAKWDRLNNIDPWGIESAQNARGYLENWNKNTNQWLRNYIYLRVTPKGKKPGFRATLATFMTSAFWHGFYPGYYLTFILGAFVQTAAKNFRRQVRPFFLTQDGKSPTKYKTYYDMFSWFVTQFSFCFVTAPFVILGLGDSIKVWARVYFYCIFGVAGLLGFFASPAKQWLRNRLGVRNHPHHLKRMATHEEDDKHQRMPTLGMLDTTEIDRAIDEIRSEVDVRRRSGSKVEFPSGEELKRAVESKVHLRRREADELGPRPGPGEPRITADLKQE